jgi:serine protease Do
LDRPVGALVNDITPDGSAERAGIEPGDVILAFNGTPVETWNDLPPLVGANPPGTEATVKVSREGKEKTFNVVLDALDSESGEAVADGGDASVSQNVLGLVVERISSDRRRELGDPEGGVVITDIESDDAWRVGLRPGDVILMINNRNVEDMDDFESLVKDIEPNRAVALRVWRNGTANFIAYTPRRNDDGEEDEG